jgi:hypothetical protein
VVFVPEYVPFVTSIQGWAQQPSLTEFENLLASQESLARQMAGTSISEGEGQALLSSQVQKTKRMRKRMFRKRGSLPRHGNLSRKTIKCYRCGKIGHIKKNCRVKLKGGNVAHKEENENGEEWDKCLMVETASVDALASINYENDWMDCRFRLWSSSYWR